MLTLTHLTPIEQRKFFLNALFKDAVFSIDLRGIQDAAAPVTCTTCLETEGMTEWFFNKYNGKLNLYYGIATKYGGLGKENVKEFVTLCCDFDVEKDIEGDYKGVINRLLKFKKPFTFLVHSGYGLHAYWVLDKPVPATDESIRAWEETQTGLANYFGSDVAVARITQPIRLPGSLNVKYGNQKLCKILVANEIKYEIEDFAEYRVELKKEIKGDIICGEDEEIQKILDMLEVVQVRSNGEIQAYCPFHEPRNSASFFINIYTGQWNCLSTSCDEPTGGGVATFFNKKWKMDVSRIAALINKGKNK